MPFVGRLRPTAFDTIGEMATKAVHPFPDRLPADRYTSFGEQVLDISRAEREAVVDPNRKGGDLAWEAVTFQAGHGGWSAHRKRLDSHETPNKLAMPILKTSDDSSGEKRLFFELYFEGYRPITKSFQR